MKKSLLPLLLIFISIFAYGQKSKIAIAATPEWVTKIVHSTNPEDSNQDGSGYYYHLLNFQTNVDRQSYFSHYTVEAVNNEGIQQISDISVDFDPKYQKLIFHKIHLIRDGSPINKLKRSAIKTAQRESDMERFLYNGTITAYVNLTDVRKGDLIDYSYTIVGFNPIYEDHFLSKIYFQYKTAAGHLHNRILVSEDRKLHFKYFNNAKKPKITKDNGFIEYLWTHENIKAALYDMNTPSWFDIQPHVSISEYNSWKEIADQYVKHYTISKHEQLKLKKAATSLFENTPKDSLFTAIQKFIQDDIRYLGFEGGMNGQKPDNPLNVLKQRYGDCKAKSFLMSELLKIYDIEAYPILVHSYKGSIIPQELPSPNLFNHCIVQIKANDTSYYVDPTISSQGGILETISSPNYKTGMVLREGTNELATIAYTPKTSTHILQEYDIDSIGGTAYMDVTTTYSGTAANNQRAHFLQKDLEKTQKEYIDFYSALHPTIRPFSKIEYIDKRQYKNEVIIKESYFIDSLWTKSSINNKVLAGEFYPLDMETYVNLKNSPKRTMPYYIQYPVNIAHTIVVNLPEPWSIEEATTTIKESAFEYTYDINYHKKKLTLSHTYKTLKDHIPAQEATAFINKHDKILDDLSYLLTYDTNYNTTSASQSTVSWILVLLFLVTMGICAYFAFRVFTEYDIQITKSKFKHEKIGGWLVLVAIGIVLTPIINTFEIFQNTEDYFGTVIWTYIIKDHESFTEVLNSGLIIFELLYNAAFLVFSILVIFLFFEKRTILPRMMVLFYGASLVIGILDSVSAFTINDNLFSEVEKIEFFKESFRAFIAAVIWIPYFLVSKRVKATFVNRYDKNVEIFTPED